jgi:hypothetical protein
MSHVDTIGEDTGDIRACDALGIECVRDPIEELGVVGEGGRMSPVHVIGADEDVRLRTESILALRR